MLILFAVRDEIDVKSEHSLHRLGQLLHIQSKTMVLSADLHVLLCVRMRMRVQLLFTEPLCFFAMRCDPMKRKRERNAE